MFAHLHEICRTVERRRHHGDGDAALLERGSEDGGVRRPERLASGVAANRCCRADRQEFQGGGRFCPQWGLAS